MTCALADTLPPLPPESTIIRSLWRMQGTSRVVCAQIRRHPAGRELVVFFEGPEDDVLETQFERLDFAVLDRRAEALRQLLNEKGWVPLTTARPPG